MSSEQERRMCKQSIIIFFSVKSKSKAVPLHAMEALGGEEI
jgi:hypothetical protein